MNSFQTNYYVSPTECFLKYLTYPEDLSIAIDLRMSAVVVMSHLDRLCTPYLPPSISHKVSITHCLPLSSADDFCKQFGPRSGPTKCRA